MKVLNIQALSPEWHEKRRVSLTGTDVVALMLGSHFGKTPLSIWARITGKVPVEQLPDAKHLEWGRRSEILNRDWLESETGRLIVAGRGLVAHDDFDWFVGTPDGEIFMPEMTNQDKPGVWEAKAPTVWTPQDWTERIPDAPQIQTQAYMQITGSTWGTASAVLVQPGAASPDLYYGDIKYDEKFQELMLETITRFWDNYVQRDIRPEPGTAKEDGQLLGKLWTGDDALSIELPGDVVDLTWQRDALVAEMKVLLERKDAIDNRVKAALIERGAAAGEDQDGNRLWSWKEKKGYPVKGRYQEPTRPLLRTKYAPE